MGKIVLTGNLPSSISSSLQLLLMHEPTIEGLVEYLSKEEIFALINYMLYRHFGEVLSIRFSPTITKSGVVLNIKEIRTESKLFKVDGIIELNPFNRSIYVEINPLENSDVKTQFKAHIDSGYIVTSGEDYEVRYYI